MQRHLVFVYVLDELDDAALVEKDLLPLAALVAKLDAQPCVQEG